MIDASEQPMEERHPAKKIKQLRKTSFPHRKEEKIRNLVSEDIKIILISSTVYEVCYNRLRSEGFNVVNESPIPFPIGRQKEFKKISYIA